MLLQNKNAVIYGAAGSLGRTIAKAFAAEGAKVFLSGHHVASVQELADEIVAANGQAEAAEVDALDLAAVNHYVKTVADQAGSIDISFNAINIQDKQNIYLTEISLEDFLRPISISMKTQFIILAMMSSSCCMTKAYSIQRIFVVPRMISKFIMRNKLFSLFL